MKDLRLSSILPALSKIFERCVNEQLREFVDSTNILPDHQSGVRPLHSSTTALSHVVNHILQATDNGDVTVLILLDLSRAFDTVHYDILLRILDFIGWNLSAVAFVQSSCQLGYSKLY
ncbi:hypothetical protein Trydic_g5281 [Trypoxylus dichotomus]